MTRQNMEVSTWPYLLAYAAILAIIYVAINYPTYLRLLGISFELAFAFAFNCHLLRCVALRK